MQLLLSCYMKLILFLLKAQKTQIVPSKVVFSTIGIQVAPH